MAQFCRLTLAGPEGPDRGKNVFRSGSGLGRDEARKSGQRHSKDQGCKRQPPKIQNSVGMPLRQDEKRDPKERID